MAENRNNGGTERNRRRALTRAEQMELEERRYRRRQLRRRKRRRKLMIRRAVFFGVPALIIIIIIAAAAHHHSVKKAEAKAAEEAAIAAAEEQAAAEAEAQTAVTTVTEVSIAAAGDNLISAQLCEQAAAAAKDGAYDFSGLYAQMEEFFLAHDASWMDVETMINNDFPASGYPAFSTPGEDGEALYNAGFNVFSLSNNHIYDYGADGVDATLRFFEKEMPSDVLVTGLWKENDYSQIPTLTMSNGKTVAFLTYTYGTNAQEPEGTPRRVIYLDELETIETQITQAHKVADAVVVSCHWGTEDSHQITDEQKRLAEDIAEMGADLIIGDHPHVVQNAEWIETSDGRKVFCAYSLGNFVSSQGTPAELIGLVLDCRLRFTELANGEQSVEVVEPRLLPVVTVYGENAEDVQVVWFADYTPEWSEEHGIRMYYPGFSYDYIQTSILEEYVDSEFLDLTDPLGNGAAQQGSASGEEETEEEEAAPQDTVHARTGRSGSGDSADSYSVEDTGELIASTYDDDE